MRTGFLSKNYAWYALNAAILKTMEYPMARTTMSEKEWNYIMGSILKAGIPRSGIDRSFPRDILYGPTCLHGLGIHHPWYHQEITHLIVSLKQTMIGGITGRCISASMEQLRLEMGLPGWLTDHDCKIFKVLTMSTWITTMRKFTHHFKIEIGDSETQLTESRFNDRFLMAEFARIGFRGLDLSKLNICQIYLHTVTLADICTVDGQALTLDTL
jgi:hypothetical protein